MEKAEKWSSQKWAVPFISRFSRERPDRKGFFMGGIFKIDELKKERTFVE